MPSKKPARGARGARGAPGWNAGRKAGDQSRAREGAAKKPQAREGIARISVEGFKSLARQTVELGRLNVLMAAGLASILRDRRKLARVPELARFAGKVVARAKAVRGASPPR